MIIAFFGHSYLFYSRYIKDKVLELFESKIGDNAVFYLSGYRNFDMLAKKCCLMYKQNHQSAKLYFITPFTDEKYLINRKYFMENIDDYIYPKIKRVPKCYAVSERNRWIVKNADLIIAYTPHNWGRAIKAVKYAEKLNKEIIYVGLHIE